MSASAFLFFVLIFAQSFYSAESALGLDTALQITPAEFSCLKKAGYSYLIARVYRSLGAVDDVGIQNILTARANGFTDVDAYIFPCLFSHCSSAASQVTDTVNALVAKNVTIGRLWLDIEDFAWPNDTISNQKFITELANSAKNLGYQVGVYTMKKFWYHIVGDSWTGASQYPLWWPQYNGALDLTTGWYPFGGWSKPVIHQVTGDSKECGLIFDKNFK